VAEWFKAPVLKTGVGASPPWVRIPPPPPRHRRSTSDDVDQCLRKLNKIWAQVRPTSLGVGANCLASLSHLWTNLWTGGMPKTTHRLTAIRLHNLKKPGLHADGAGLYLKVLPSGSKSWVFRFMRGGKARYLGLGLRPRLPSRPAGQFVRVASRRRDLELKAGAGPPGISAVNPDVAAREVVSRWRASGLSALRIDGFLGAGKTTIVSNRVERLTGTKAIHVDHYILETHPRQSWRQALDIPRLHNDVTLALAANSPLIFEGVCLDEILPVALFGNGFRVYVKRVASSGLWEGLDLEEAGMPADLLAPSDWLPRDVWRYHQTCRPDKNADVVVTVPELP
jgi:hypothetical protein